MRISLRVFVPIASGDVWSGSNACVVLISKLCWSMCNPQDGEMIKAGKWYVDDKTAGSEATIRGWSVDNLGWPVCGCVIFDRT